MFRLSFLLPILGTAFLVRGAAIVSRPTSTVAIEPSDTAYPLTTSTPTSADIDFDLEFHALDDPFCTGNSSGPETGATYSVQLSDQNGNTSYNSVVPGKHNCRSLKFSHLDDDPFHELVFAKLVTLGGKFSGCNVTVYSDS